MFSLFKKKTEKMPGREIMRPRPPATPGSPQSTVSGSLKPTVKKASEEIVKVPEPLPDLEFTRKVQSAPAPTPSAAKPGAPKTKVEMELAMSEFDREFTNSSVMAINVDHGSDSIQSDIEQVAVLYANGQDAVIRPLLQSLLGAYPGTEGLRLWQMLFDFLELSGDRVAFEKLTAEFVEACEMSPPAWREVGATPNASSGGLAVESCELQGVLTADDVKMLAPLVDALKTKRPLRVECGRLAGCDDEIAGRLADLLTGARHQGAVIVLDNVEALIPRLRRRLKAGEAANARSWLLLLELLQRHATQEDFEHYAIDFAVTFERSPPSWEVVSLPKLPAGKATSQAKDAHYLSGEIKNSRFDDLISVLNLTDNAVLDFSGVRRMDFASAGQLVNILAPFKAGGKDVIVRSPNHLVAELMAVVGLNKVARIIVPKS